ncbi:tRNA (Guanine37-N1)-methyltransferase [Crocosphaera watsonii WH 0401]|uniref:tRNA (Guanine37-N1)-methyltransferase n=1 Tax=Crocosphaera watsonii WH 0401 TaxID=555881 RepID=T2JGN0_CROWT|nr:tRNA (Guanine37-N1)-methyltransferase [Crocosphaera watsonii WH 0401]
MSCYVALYQFYVAEIYQKSEFGVRSSEFGVRSSEFGVSD